MLSAHIRTHTHIHHPIVPLAAVTKPVQPAAKRARSTLGSHALMARIHTHTQTHTHTHTTNNIVPRAVVTKPIQPAAKRARSTLGSHALMARMEEEEDAEEESWEAEVDGAEEEMHR